MSEEILTGQAAVAEGDRMTQSGPSGYHKRMVSEAHRARVAEALDLFGRAYNGDGHAKADLHEAMSTSDFPILFGDALNRSLAAQYAARPPVWQQFAARTTVPDFRKSKIVDFLGGAGLLDDIPELGEYPARSFSEDELSISVGKKGARLHWSWEMNVNDDLGAFQRAPGQLSRGARSTEDHTVTSVLCDSSGPKSWLGTIATDALDEDGLNKGLQALNEAKDDDGNPIDVGTPVLVIPPALQLTAQKIINTVEVRQGGSSKTRIQRGNGLLTTPQVVVNRWLSSINTTNGDKAWYLLPDPNGPRPAVFAAFLRGHEQPELRVKADAGMYLGGGNVPASEGSFERDSVEYRLRHVIGAAQGFDDAVYASKGGS